MKRAFNEGSNRAARLIYALVNLRIRKEAEPHVLKTRALRKIEMIER
jgi:hypothetical protein